MYKRDKKNVLVETVLGTIHLRRQQIVTIFDPYSLPSAFFITIHWHI